MEFNNAFDEMYFKGLNDALACTRDSLKKFTDAKLFDKNMYSGHKECLQLSHKRAEFFLKLHNQNLIKIGDRAPNGNLIQA